MPYALFTFIGNRDFVAANLLRDANTSTTRAADELGPVARAICVADERWASAHLINDRAENDPGEAYVQWLDNLARRLLPESRRPQIFLHHEPFESRDPTDFAAVYEACTRVLRAAKVRNGEERVFLVSAGTPTMATVWMLLSQTQRYAARLAQTHATKGFEWIELPVEVAHELRDRRPKAPGALPLDESRLLEEFLMTSAALREPLAYAQRVAATPFGVLISGETGTGKEVLAWHMHLWGLGVDFSDQTEMEKARSTFKAVHCAALPPELVESELFGHRKGSFSGATADHEGIFRSAGEGTVFLDEIGDMPLAQQAKLLRALETKLVRPVGDVKEYSIDARVISATHRNLAEEVRSGRFREDLYYRLVEGGMIHLPPLRERGDIVPLAKRLLERIADDVPELGTKTLDDSARRVLLAYSWPGNVRELLHTLKHAAVRSAGNVITSTTLEACLPRLYAEGTGLLDRPLPLEGCTLDHLVEELDAHYLLRAHEQAGGNATRAAELLGLGRTTYANRLKKARKRLPR